MDLRARCLEAVGKGVLPTKLTYCGEAAVAYDQLARHRGYESLVMAVDNEVAAIRALPPPAASSICDLGSGNGLHAVALMRGCAERGLPVRRYLALDISPRLLAIAELEVHAALPDVEVAAAEWDFEESVTAAIRRWRRGAPALIVMLGLTLGNVEDPRRVLANVRRSVEAGDMLLLGVAAAPSEPGLALAAYRSREFMEAALAPFVVLGLDADDLAVDVWWEPGCVRAAVRACRTVRFPGSAVVLNRNSRVTVMQSRRFRPDEIEGLAEAAGWRVAGETRLDAVGHLTVTLVATARPLQRQPDR